MRYSLSVLLLVCCLGSYAQESTDSTESNEPWSIHTTPKVLKFSPLDVFSVVPTFGADLEVKMKDRLALQAGIGIIPSFFQYLSNENFNDYDRMGGYKLRTEGRLYRSEKPNRYIGLGISFRHLIIRDEVPIGMEGVVDEWGQDNFAYFVNTPMVFHRFNTNVDLKYGFQKVIDGNLVFDFYFGLSMRAINVQSNSEIPEGGSIPQQRGMWTLEDNRSLNYATPIVGFKVGFVH